MVFVYVCKISLRFAVQDAFVNTVKKQQENEQCKYSPAHQSADYHHRQWSEPMSVESAAGNRPIAAIPAFDKLRSSIQQVQN